MVFFKEFRELENNWKKVEKCYGMSVSKILFCAKLFMRLILICLLFYIRCLDLY